MFENSALENIHIYLSNVSIYYVISIVISCVAVFVSFYFKDNAFVPMKNDGQDSTTSSDTEDVSSGQSASLDPFVSKKVFRSKLPEKLLTFEQREEEKRVKKEQLAAIFKLLQEQEDKFQMNTMDQFKDQMKLYWN